MQSARYIIAMLGMSSCIAAFADAASDYNRRAADRDISLFRALDRNADGRLTRAEAHGTIDVEARFSDIDADRDDTITFDELRRYITLHYGVAPAPTPASNAPR